MLNQIAVFLENKKGRVREACIVLKENSIDLRSLMIADTKDFGILRLTTDNNEKACKVLKEARFLVSSSNLIGIEIPDRTGALADILTEFDAADINIEYLYSMLVSDKEAKILFKTSHPEKATEILTKMNVKFF